jgi:hypothetical protein
MAGICHRRQSRRRKWGFGEKRRNAPRVEIRKRSTVLHKQLNSIHGIESGGNLNDTGLGDDFVIALGTGLDREIKCQPAGDRRVKRFLREAADKAEGRARTDPRKRHSILSDQTQKIGRLRKRAGVRSNSKASKSPVTARSNRSSTDSVSAPLSPAPNSDRQPWLISEKEHSRIQRRRGEFAERSSSASPFRNMRPSRILTLGPCRGAISFLYPRRE